QSLAPSEPCRPRPTRHLHQATATTRYRPSRDPSESRCRSCPDRFRRGEVSMGEGEYGGNGSIHWKVKHGNGRSITCTGKTDAYGIDDDPKDNSGGSGGEFKVTVDDVGPTAYSYNAATKTLTVSVPIKHGLTYKKQIRIQWPK